MVPLLIQITTTAATFFPPSSRPSFLLKGTPQASNYPIQHPRSQFILENHISISIYLKTHYNWIPSLTEGPHKFHPHPNINTQTPQKTRPPQKDPSSSSVASPASASRLDSTFTNDYTSPDYSSHLSASDARQFLLYYFPYIDIFPPPRPIL